MPNPTASQGRLPAIDSFASRAAASPNNPFGFGGESDPIPGALAIVRLRGNLMQELPDRADRLALMQMLSGQQLVIWNRAAGAYELTVAGHRRLHEHQTRREVPASIPLRASDRI